VQHVALPAPGTDRQLDELVQLWHGELLDRHRPLFQLIVVEGLAGGRFAIFAKLHHSIADGVSAITRLLGSLSRDPAARLQPPLFAVDLDRPHRAQTAGGIGKSLARSAGELKRQAVAAGELSIELLEKLLSRGAGVPSRGSAPFEAPTTPINAPVRQGRAFAHLSLPLEPLRAAAKSMGGTLNDAVLAIVDDAVTRYLGERGYEGRRPLHALVPVSLRAAGTAEEGSSVSSVVCALGDPVADVGTRLAQTIERMDAAKARIRRFSKTAAADYFVALFFLAQGLGAAGIRQPVANFVVSNVPGTANETFLGGARLLGVYPMNVLAVGLGLSVTLVSRAGQLDIGLVANRSALPDPQRIASLCREAFETLTRKRSKRVLRPAAAQDARRAAPPLRAKRPGHKQTRPRRAAAGGH
jgi:WS/DGAT/MGAT family acyltransferase